MSSKQQTIGAFLFSYLHHIGVKDVFGIPGDFALPTFRWLEESPLNLYTLSHEPSVGFAADCYARANGFGVALVTYCVGGLNMLNSIACAYAEKSPVLVISGAPSPQDKKADQLLHHKVKTFDTQHNIFKEVTCATAVLNDPETAAAEIIRVINEMRKQCRPGYIEIPFDIVDLPIGRIPSQPIEVESSDTESLEVALTEMAECINGAKQPVLLAGIELHRHGFTDLAVEFAQKHNIPIAATLLSKSVIRETNPLYIGVYSGAIGDPICREYVDNSDCVIMLGTFMTDMLLGINTSKLHRKTSMHITTEETRIGMHYYEKINFKDFLDGMHKTDIKIFHDFDNPNPWAEPEPLSYDNDAIATVEGFFEALAHHIPEGSTIISDTGDALLGAVSLRTSKRRRFFADAYYLSMGFAVPASVGAMVADPNSRAFVIVGDGAFQMTGIEMTTIAKYKMKPIIVVINNEGYGTQRHIVDGEFNNIHPWNYPKLTELLAYGQSARVTTMKELDDVLQRAINTDDLFFIEVVVPRDDCSKPLKRLGEELHKLRNNN